MNFVISIVNPDALSLIGEICHSLEVPISLNLYGRGTATKRTLDLLGIDSKQRRVVMCIADSKKAEQLMALQRRHLYMDAPGNGIVLSIPIKSIGGRKTMSYLSDANVQQIPKSEPFQNYSHELILVIANEGYTDMVMDAAREAGASGGTVLHGKGTASERTEKFFGISVAQEKEMVMIVAETHQKAAIMRSVLHLAGPKTAAGAIVFSLPVSSIAGIGMNEAEADVTL